MQVEKLTAFIQAEKKCTAEEALQVVELLEFPDGGNADVPVGLKKSALDLWEMQFGQSNRNFGLSRDAFQSLVDRLRAGDQALFERVFLQHFSACMNFLIHQKNIPQHIAYDASMDTLITFRQMLVEGKADYGNLRFLFTRMAVFAALKMRHKDARIVPVDNLKEVITPEPEGVDEESVLILGKAWKKLTDECRQLLGQFYYNNQSWKEIGDLLQITEGNARKKGQRCRETLVVYVKKLI